MYNIAYCGPIQSRVLKGELPQNKRYGKRHLTNLSSHGTNLQTLRPALADIVLQFFKFSNKSAINQITYNLWTHSDPPGPSG